MSGLALLATFAMIMNKEKWESLPPDIQAAIMSVSGAEGAAFGGQTAWAPEVGKEVQAKIAKEGQKLERVALDPGELERWKEIGGKPLWDKWVTDMEAKGLPGQKILDGTLKLAEKYKD